MDSAKHEISHVSDTALMVAAARAVETARPSYGLVHDPFAERLAGERGMAILRDVDRFGQLTFGVGMRSRFLDQLLLQVLGEGESDTVLQMGAGLDARPWRLDLPGDLRWIEVDFPDILDYKAEVLASEKPSCHVERIVADLNDGAQRQAVFSSASGRPGSMITEGLLMYLPPKTLEALADEAARMNGIRYWLLDVASQDMMRRAHRDCQDIENVRPKDYLKGEQILDLARSHGWRMVERRTYTGDGRAIAGDRIKELPDSATMADDRNRPTDGDPSGVYLFGR